MTKANQAESERSEMMPAVVLSSAFDTWSRSVQKMCECRNPVDFVQSQQDWLCDAVRLAVLDIRSLAGDTAILARRMAAEFEKPAGPDDDLSRRRRGVPKWGRDTQWRAWLPSK